MPPTRATFLTQQRVKRTSPPTITVEARPFRSHPTNGVLALFDRSCPGATLQRTSGSMIVISASAPIAREPFGMPRIRAGLIVIFAKEKKMQELDQAPFGIVGLETSLGLVVTRLIEPGHLDWSAALAKMTINPARILGIPKAPWQSAPMPISRSSIPRSAGGSPQAFGRKR